MTCDRSRQWIPPYLDGELEPSIAAGHAVHLAACEVCREACAQEAGLRKTIAHNAARYPAPATLRARILNELNDLRQADAARGSHASAEPYAPGIGRRRWASGLVGRFGGIGTWSQATMNVGIASLSSLAFVVTLALYIQTPSANDLLEQEIVATHFRSLQVDHLADVVSSDQHTVKPWFTGKLDYSPPVVDAAQEGYALLGGRLDYLNRRSVAGLAYRHGKHLVNLFVWPDTETGDAAGKMASVRGFNVLRWTRDGMAYAAVSDMHAGELLTFRKLLTAKIDNEAKTP